VATSSFSFDGPSRRITLVPGTVTLSVIELWTAYCDWLAVADNSKWGDWMRSVGRDTNEIPLYVFLAADVRIIPQSAHHTLTVSAGILGVDGGGDPFANPAGSYMIRMNWQAPGIAIAYSSGGGSNSGGMTVGQFLALKDI
jgi:hypothetical protein